MKKRNDLFYLFVNFNKILPNNYRIRPYFNFSFFYDITVNLFCMYLFAQKGILTNEILLLFLLHHFLLVLYIFYKKITINMFILILNIVII